MKLLKQILKHLLFLFLTDITAVCILEQFQNQASIVTADRVLKELGSQKAKENVKARITFVFCIEFFILLYVLLYSFYYYFVCSEQTLLYR